MDRALGNKMVLSTDKFGNITASVLHYIHPLQLSTIAGVLLDVASKAASLLNRAATLSFFKIEPSSFAFQAF